MFPQPVIDAIEQQLGIVHRVDGTLIFSNKAPKNFAATVVSSAVKKARVEIAGQQQSSSPNIVPSASNGLSKRTVQLRRRT